MSASVVPEEPAPSGWHLLRYPRTPERAAWAGKKPNGAVQLTLDGWRIEVHGKRAVLAEQALFGAIARSCPSGGGWLHFTHEKDVYWSPTFLGDLQLVGKFESLDLVQCGPEVVLGGSPPTVWSKAGPRPLEHSESILWASFSSPLEGRALAMPDIPLVTRDGGRTFARAGTVDVAAAAAAAKQAGQQENIDYRDLTVAVQAWLERAVRSEAGRAVGGTLLADGTWLHIGGVEKLGIIAARKPDGTVHVVTVADECDYWAWGKQLIGRCPETRGPGGTPSVRVVYPTASALGEMPTNFTDPVPDPDGKYVFGDTGPDGGERSLVRFDGRAWRSFPTVRGTPHVARHGWLVIDEPLRIVSADEPERVAFTFPTGTEIVPHAPDGPDDTGHRYRVVQVDVNEVALLERSVIFVDRRREYDAQLVEVELPSGRELRKEAFRLYNGSLGFADAEHGISASSYQPAQLLALGRSPSPLPEATLPQGYVRGVVACSDHTCVIDGEQAYTRLPFRPEKKLTSAPKTAKPPEPEPTPAPVDEKEAERLAAAEEKQFQREEAERVEAERWPLAFRVKEYACELTQSPGKARFDEELRGSTSPTDENPQPIAKVVPTYGGLVDSAPEGRALSWRGLDAKGEFRVRTAESDAMAELTSKLPIVTGESEILPALVTRRFAVLFAQPSLDPQKLWVARDSGQVDLLLDGVDHFTVVPLDDGRALLRAEYESHQQLILLGADGSVSARRSSYVQSESYLAVRGSEPGFVLMGEEPQFFSMTPASVGTLVAAPELRYAEPCRTKAKPDALQLFVEAVPYVEVGGLEPRSRSWGTHQATDPQLGHLGIIEVSPKSMCLRSVLLDAPLSGRLVSEAPWMHGRVLGQSKSYSVVCRGIEPSKYPNGR